MGAAKLMPQYFFNVHDGKSIPDLERTELRDIDAARREAVRFSSELLADHAEEFWMGEDWKVEVTDAAGLILFVLQFSATKSPALGTP